MVVALEGSAVGTGILDLVKIKILRGVWGKFGFGLIILVSKFKARNAGNFFLAVT